ncbi:MAG: hypothetical protein ACOC56_06205 [Atribacterota bacterium]
MLDDNEDFDVDKNEVINYVRQSLNLDDDVSDYEIQEMLDSGQIKVDFVTFDEETSNDFDKLLKEIEEGNDINDEYKNAIIQRMHYLMTHGEKEEIKNEDGINISSIKEKKFNDENTDDINPIDEDEFKKMFGEQQ